MDLLDVLTVFYGSEARTIELHRGDLTNLGPQEAVDLLVIASFPNSYLPITGTAIGYLYRRGVSVEELAANKAHDFRVTCSCWLSQELSVPPKGIQIKRILCYEPPIFGIVTEVVSDLFRCLAQVLNPEEPVSMAIPLGAIGSRGEPISDVIAAIMDAAIRWMALGLPVKQLKLVEQSSAKAVEMLRVFDLLKGSYPTALPTAHDSYEVDLLISYAAKDSSHAAQAIAAALQELRPALRISLDRQELEPGAAWQHALYKRVSSCRGVVALYSPLYLRSKTCQEEFNLALYRHYASPAPTLVPIFAYDAALPAYMQRLPFIDCRQGDDERLQAACADVLATLEL